MQVAAKRKNVCTSGQSHSCRIVKSLLYAPGAYVDAEDYRVPLERFAPWYPFLLKAVCYGFCQCSIRVTYFHTNAYNPSLIVA